MSGLLAEARATNDAFSQLTLALAREVGDLQALCMLSLPESAASGETNEDAVDGQERAQALRDAIRKIARKVGDEFGRSTFKDGSTSGKRDCTC